MTWTPVDLALDRLADRLANPSPVARIAINRRPVQTAWGGGNQWLQQIVRSLRSQGYSVRYDLERPVDCVLLVDPRPGDPATFGAREVATARIKDPRLMCIQRVNENDQHRGSTTRDALLASANEVADHTVFISSWVRDYHAARWFDRGRPHSVILNGADSRFYHPIGGTMFEPGGPLRLVTHHWSDNWAKGFDVYVEIDRLIAAGKLPQTELWVIGRWPNDARWQAAQTFPPVRNASLAGLLRRCHVYVTASRWESGGMHMLEGARCGLPMLFHVDGGGSAEVACRFGIGFRNDIASAIEDMRREYQRYRDAVLVHAPSGDQMCLAYRRLIERMIIDHHQSTGADHTDDS